MKRSWRPAVATILPFFKASFRKISVVSLAQSEKRPAPSYSSPLRWRSEIGRHMYSSQSATTGSTASSSKLLCMMRMQRFPFLCFLQLLQSQLDCSLLCPHNSPSYQQEPLLRQQGCCTLCLVLACQRYGATATAKACPLGSCLCMPTPC